MPTVNRTFTPPAAAAAAFAAAFALLASTAAAGTVVPMNLETLADHAGQVLVGRVVSVRSYWADPGAPGRRIESEVIFEQVEYHQGARRDSTPTFSLVVPGGTIGETQMRVCCAPQFAAGDKWVLFLLPTYRTLPVVGLYQGAFLVRPDADGVERVYQVRHRTAEPVMGLDSEGFIRAADRRRSPAHEHLVGATNAVLKIEPGRTGAAEAMSYEDIIARIHSAVAHSRDHRLAEPAGRPERLCHRPAPPERATGDRCPRPADAGSGQSVLRATAKRGDAGEPQR